MSSGTGGDSLPASVKAASARVASSRAPSIVHTPASAGGHEAQDVDQKSSDTIKVAPGPDRTPSPVPAVVSRGRSPSKGPEDVHKQKHSDGHGLSVPERGGGRRLSDGEPDQKTKELQERKDHLGHTDAALEKKREQILDEALAFLSKTKLPNSPTSKSAVPTSRPDRPDRPENDSPQYKEQRDKIVAEVLSTEKTYLSGLLSLMQNYLHPLIAQTAKGKGMKDLRTLESFMGHTHGIATLHTRLSGEWHTEPNLEGMLKHLAAMVPFFKHYFAYIQAYPALLLEINQQSSAALTKFLSDIATHQKHLGIQQLLILPVQRIPRYVLLLEAIEKHTPNTHPQLPNLEQTLSKVRVMAGEINAYQRECENSTKLFFLHNQIKGLPDDFVILRPSRLLLKDGVLCRGEADATQKHPHKSSVRWFLFNSSLVLTDWQYRYMERVDLEYVQPRERSGVGGVCVLELLTGLDADELEPNNTFICENATDRAEWTSLLKTARYSLIVHRAAPGSLAKRGSVELSQANSGYDLLSTPHAKLNIYMRIRPFISPSEHTNGTVCLRAKGKIVTLQQIGSSRADRVANYDMVFNPTDKQGMVFNVVGPEVLGAIFSGCNAAIMAYGNTGAGKTYTMFGALDKEGNFSYNKPTASSSPSLRFKQGDTGWVMQHGMPRLVKIKELLPQGKFKVAFTDTKSTMVMSERELIGGFCEDEDDDEPRADDDNDPRGLIPRLLECLFDAFEDGYESKDITMSYIQVYNNEIHDLQREGSLVDMQLKWVKEGHYVPVSLTETKVASCEEAINIITQGNKRRVTRSHKMNELSSRSHAIVSLRVSFVKQGKRTTSQLQFIDLAGSEAVGDLDPEFFSNTDFARGNKEQELALAKEESKFINQSLVTLGRVVYALIENEKRKKKAAVPFRDSKLTMLLKDVLEGEFVCTLILNASPSPADNQVNLSAKTMAFGEGIKKLQSEKTAKEDLERSQKHSNFLASVWASVQRENKKK